MYEVRTISFSYPQRKVLRDVSFVVSPGEAVSVVGDNGAGKTTLLKILATLAQPDSGTVMMDAQDALSRPLRYRRQLGYMGEECALYEDMRVKDYLEYRAALKGEPEKRIRRRVGGPYSSRTGYCSNENKRTFIKSVARERHFATHRRMV